MAVRAAGCVLLVAALGMPLSVPAQNPKSDSAGQITRTVQFVATGPNGQPVMDLRPEEIQVSDDGKRYPLISARLLVRAVPGAPLGPREFSNRADDTLASSVLILLDLLNANITERGSAWNETTEALQKQEKPENIFVYLLTPDANLYPVRAWGPPPAPGESPTPPAAPWTSQAHRLLDDALHVAEGVKPTDLTAAPGLTVGPTYQALTNLAGQYSALPGQKRIIWVTHGLPLTVPTYSGPYDFTPQLKQVAARFNQLGVAMYTVHQLDRSTNGGNTQETLQTLPPLTGGRWFENDSIGPALVQAQTDARATYLAAYDDTGKQQYGKFHKLRVSTTRKGVKILAVDGYIAVPLDETAKNKFDLVANRPFDTSDIGLRASLELGAKTATFHIRADPRDLLLQHSGNSYAGAVSISLLLSDADGSASALGPTVTNLNLTQDQYDSAMKDGYLINVERALPPRTSRVRIMAQDPATGLAGSLTLPVSGSP